MTKVKIGMSVLLLAALCLPGFWVLAGDDDDRPNSDNLKNAANVDPDDGRPDEPPRLDDVRSDDDRDSATSNDRAETDDDVANGGPRAFEGGSRNCGGKGR